MSAHVVVVEDEPVTRSLLAAHLRKGGYRVSSLDRADALPAMIADGGVDLVLMDIELPGEDGLASGASLRATSPEIGLIFVTRRSDVVDRVVGLEIGADDYVTKPPEMRELLARVKAVLRRRATSGSYPAAPADVSKWGLGSWRLDASRACLVDADGEEVAVTRGEQIVLESLLAAEGRVVPRRELIESLSRHLGATNPRSVDVLVHRIRRKLGEGGPIEPRIILTVHGVGYRVAGEA